jgi:hypothetical protein
MIPRIRFATCAAREGTKLSNIGRVFIGSKERDYFHGQASHDAIVSWAEAKKLDVIVWTDLQINFQDKRCIPFSVQEALSYVQSLPPKGKAKAVEYVWRAPCFVQTPLRTALQQEPWFSPVR